MPSLASRVASIPPKRQDSLWAGPSGAGDLGGVTQSMLHGFLACRERFRVKYVRGLRPADQWNKHMGYGNMWHVCEEALAAQHDWGVSLLDYTVEQTTKYPMQREEITKWWNVCKVQFPEYVKWWSAHPDVIGRTPLMQEQVFDVPYALPSGRVVRLRGKFDSVDLITVDGVAGIWLQENKTKSDVDEINLTRQLRFDLQTMMYQIALGIVQETTSAGPPMMPIMGVRYNVVRRPLSGGVGSITQHKAKTTKPTYSKKDGRVLKPSKMTPAETDTEFYERLRRDYLADDPGYWFFRVQGSVSQKDIEVFRSTCLDPILENLCWWYDEVMDQIEGHDQNRVAAVQEFGYPPASWRQPYGGYSAMHEGSATEYDAYLETGNEAGLHQVDTLFEELQ